MATPMPPYTLINTYARARDGSGAVRGGGGHRAPCPLVSAKDVKLTEMCIYMHETLIMGREVGMISNILFANGVILHFFANFVIFFLEITEHLVLWVSATVRGRVVASDLEAMVAAV